MIIGTVRKNVKQKGGIMPNKNVWRYIFYYEKFGSNDKYYFDIFTDKGKSVAEKLAIEKMSDWDTQYKLIKEAKLITKRLHSKG